MLDKARFAFELVGVYRPKLPAPEVTVDASPHLSSPLSRQRAKKGLDF